MTSHPLEIVHTDLCGPTRTKSLHGGYYFMFLIDDYTRMTWVTFLKEKSEAFEKFKIFKAMVKNETYMKIKCLRLDNGGEFTSNEFNEFCEIQGIKRQFSVAKTPQQNDVVERKNRTVQEAARIMLNQTKMSDSFWKEAVYTVVYILNIGQISVNKDKIPYEFWYGRPASVKYFKVFGSNCYIKRNKDDLGNISQRKIRRF